MNWQDTRRRLHEQEITWEKSAERLKGMGFDCREDCRPGSGGELIFGDLSGANLAEMDLKFASMEESNLSNALLYGAILYKANLEYADLTNADLRGADLEQAILCGANLSNADLRGATLKGAQLIDANLQGVKYNKDTEWPLIKKVEVTWLSFDPESVGAVKVD